MGSIRLGFVVLLIMHLDWCESLAQVKKQQQQQQFTVDPNYAEALDGCAKTHGVSVKDLDSIFDKPYKTVSMELKCATKCTMEKCGTIGSNGQFDAKAFRDRYSFVDKNTIADVIAKCELVKEKDLCEYAYQIGDIVFGKHSRVQV